MKTADHPSKEVKLKPNNTVAENKREGWAEAFKEMAKNGDDELVIPFFFEDEDWSDWTFTSAPLPQVSQ